MTEQLNSTKLNATPAAKWREEGLPDPHINQYNCERAGLALGDYTDDELANAVFMHGNGPFDPARAAAGQPMPIVLLTAAKERIRWLSRSLISALDTANYQARVQPWLLECFGPMIAGDREERNHRFLEEALELVQSTGCTASEAHQLVDYVFNRPIGEPSQEVGGVMVTLAALCNANNLNMHQAGETELERVNQPEMLLKIRAKQAAKPKHSPLPQETKKEEPIFFSYDPADGFETHKTLAEAKEYAHSGLDHYRDLLADQSDIDRDGPFVDLSYGIILGRGTVTVEQTVTEEDHKNDNWKKYDVGTEIWNLSISPTPTQGLKFVPAGHAILPNELTPVIKSVLGMMCFKTSPYAHIYQSAGFNIPKKTEEEQAFVLHRWLLLALEHGNNWPLLAQKEIEELRAKVVKVDECIQEHRDEARESGHD